MQKTETEPLRISYFKPDFTWREIADAARTTIRMEEGTKEPTSAWKRKILLSEHSPIRLMLFKWKWINLKYWVSVHFVRHKIGIEHFVSTQRTDRTGVCRDEVSQDATVHHQCAANAQSIIFISRKRLCAQASAETNAAWKLVLAEIKSCEPELCQLCVPECVYRGFCPEFKSCGYSETEKFQEALKSYRG
ncbi:MAG: thymidylate synthase ThyX [Kiritimatiellae bacterium]|nr:thymidylate synthase ThyX [Kiritimatiellia bacterium]